MNLGTLFTEWIPFEPQYENNLELPESERMSLEILPARVADFSRSKGRDRQWYRRWWKSLEGHRREPLHPDYRPDDIVQGLDVADWYGLWMFCNHTRNFRNFSFTLEAGEQQQVDDPVQLFFLMPAGGLLLSITNAILQAQGQTLDPDEIPS